MSTFQKRFVEAFNAEIKRRNEAGEPRLTKTMVWKAAGATSGAFTQWFDGTTGMKLDTCFLVSPLLRVNPHWLFNESAPMRDTSQSVKPQAEIEAKASIHRLQDPRIAKVVELMEATDDTGRAIALNHVQVALQSYQPSRAKKGLAK